MWNFDLTLIYETPTGARGYTQVRLTARSFEEIGKIISEMKWDKFVNVEVNIKRADKIYSVP